MDKNELANILQEPNKFQVPHETEEEQEIVFKLPEDNAEEDLLKYSEGEYDPEYEEDISLEADDKYGKEEDNQGRSQTKRVRVLLKMWQHLQARE